MAKKFLGLVALLLALAGHCDAASPVIVKGEAGLRVTEQDLIVDMTQRRVPANLQTNVLKNPESMARLATNLYIRRVLARDAEQKGLADDEQMATALRLARDVILSDAMLVRAEGETPDAATLEALASTDYKGNPERYRTPEQLVVRHILIDKKRSDGRAVAEGLLKRLRDGEDFAKLAAMESDDPGSKAQGGKLGPFARGVMDKKFEEAAFGLAKVGQLSDVIASRFGFHVIRLEERQASVLKPFEEVKPALIQQAVEAYKSSRRSAVVEPIRAAVPLDVQAIEAIVAEWEKKAPSPPAAAAAAPVTGAAPQTPVSATPPANAPEKH
jgi:peptidyl-prolyl cis-trans isomerase C